tara:strand:+ start:885 stop:1121 length:237 start_codon:yes stop_codon:yes gene_type:complete
MHKSPEFDNYFPEYYIKNHKENNWNYWKRGYELDRYEIYKLGNNYYKMIIPLKYDSFRVHYNKKEELLNHLDIIKNTL